MVFFVPTSEPVWLLFLYTCLIFLIYVVLLGVYNVYLHPLARFPGPKLWAAYRLTYAISLQKGLLHIRMKEFHECYGSIVRIAPDELSFTDARAWKDIYGVRPGQPSFPKAQVWFKPANAGDLQFIMSPLEEVHARFRKVLVHAFSDKSLKEQAPLIESYVNLLIRQLRFASHAPVDLVEWLNFTTFDITGDLCFGECFDSLKHGKAHPWVQIASDFGKGIAMIAAVNFYPPLDKLLGLMIPKKILARTRSHREISRAKVMKRLSTETDRPDFITYILRQNKQDEAKVGSKAMTPAEIGLNMTVLIFAGSETTASALSGIMRMLLQNRDSMTKLSDEIRSSFATETEITSTSMGRLTYLDAVINEGLRLCPPVVVGVPRVTPAAGDLVCGQFVPGKTTVIVNQYPTFRSRHNFQNPDAFTPERFLSPAPGDDMSAFQPFQIGRHSCIGQSLAYFEMRLILARLIYAFDFQLADPDDEWDWGAQKTFILWDRKPLKVILKPVAD